MAFNDTDINICSRALNAIGAESITSFTEGSTEAKVANQKYQTSKLKLLSIYPWSFNKSEVYIAKLQKNDLAKYQFFYEKPNDFLVARTLKENDRVVEYCFACGKINTDATEPSLVYSANCDEFDMPPYFVSLLIDLCARDFLIPVTGKNDDYGIFDKIYQSALAEAKSVDAMSKTPSRINSDLLIGVR